MPLGMNACKRAAVRALLECIRSEQHTEKKSAFKSTTFHYFEISVQFPRIDRFHAFNTFFNRFADIRTEMKCVALESKKR